MTRSHRHRHRHRQQRGRASVHVIGALALLVSVGLLGVVAFGRDDPEPGPRATAPATATDCLPGPGRPAPTVDLSVQASTLDSLLPREKVDRLVAIAKKAGATVISTSTSWRYLQPTADTRPADFRYEGIDRVIDAARASGMQVRLQLIGMPAWAVDDLDRPWSATRAPLTPGELERWSTFVSQVASHVKDTVDYLEIWNEPNGKPYWPTGPDPQAFADLLEASYAPVKDVAPGMQVVSGGLVGNDIGYLQRLYEAFDREGLTTRPFDLVGVHPFTGAASPDTVDPARTYKREPFGLFDENFTGFRSLHEVMQQAGDGDKDLYITSFGYGSRANRGEPAVPDDVRAGYVSQALEAVTCAPYVRALSWYYLHPTPFDPVAWTLVNDNLRPNLTYRAFVQWNKTVAPLGEPVAPGPAVTPTASPGPSGP